ncbi:MAG: cupin domain-containing protein [Pseudomonadota bacterium]
MSDEAKPAARTMDDAYAHLGADGAVSVVPLTEGFWSRGVMELPPGRLVSRFRNDADWTSWERHPAGEEWVYQIAGATTLILDTAQGEERIRLEAGSFVIVPRGVWHTADLIEPGEMLFITAGEGTGHRER